MFAFEAVKPDADSRGDPFCHPPRVRQKERLHSAPGRSFGYTTAAEEIQRVLELPQFHQDLPSSKAAPSNQIFRKPRGRPCVPVRIGKGRPAG